MSGNPNTNTENGRESELLETLCSTSIPDGYEKEISRAISTRTVSRSEEIEKMIIEAGSVDFVLKALDTAMKTNTNPWMWVRLLAKRRPITEEDLRNLSL